MENRRGRGILKSWHYSNHEWGIKNQDVIKDQLPMKKADSNSNNKVCGLEAIVLGHLMEELNGKEEVSHGSLPKSSFQHNEGVHDQLLNLKNIIFIR